MAEKVFLKNGTEIKNNSETGGQFCGNFHGSEDKKIKH